MGFGKRRLDLTEILEQEPEGFRGGESTEPTMVAKHTMLAMTMEEEDDARRRGGGNRLGVLAAEIR